MTDQRSSITDFPSSNSQYSIGYFLITIEAKGQRKGYPQAVTSTIYQLVKRIPDYEPVRKAEVSGLGVVLYISY